MINIIIVIANFIWPWVPDYPGSWPWTFSTWRRSTSTIMNGKGSWWTTTGSLFYLSVNQFIRSHIFFDDCMERATGEKGEMIVNQFVRHLVSAIDEFGKKWYFLIFCFNLKIIWHNNKAWMIFSKEIWNPGTEKGSFVSNHQWRLLLHMADGWYCSSSFWY